MSPLVSVLVFFVIMLLPTEAITLDRLKDRVAAAQPVAVEASEQAKALGPITVTGVGSSGASFTGTFLPQSSQVINGALAVVGTLTGTLISATGAAIGTVTQTVNMIVNQASGTCQLLHLNLNGLDVNLLGTDIKLAPVNLDISATAGSGLLLGTLLCTVASLLGTGLVTLSTLPPALLGLLAAVLTQILALVFGLALIFPSFCCSCVLFLFFVGVVVLLVFPFSSLSPCPAPS